jgi:hypothetical protein
MEIILERGKRPSERFPIGINFRNDLEPGDAVASFAVTALDADTGADITLAATESTALTGAAVTTVIKAGAAGQKYRIKFEVDTVLGLHYEHSILLTILATA